MKATFSVEPQAKDLKHPNLISRPRGRAHRAALARRQSKFQDRIGLGVYRSSFKEIAVVICRPSNNKIQRTGAAIHSLHTMLVPAADLERSIVP